MSDDETDPENPVDAGLQHLEAAARELIQAGRSFLDAVESSLGRPGAVEDLWSAVRDAAGSSWASPDTPTGSTGAPPASDEEKIDIEIDLDPDGHSGSGAETEPPAGD